ncbi:MAG: hypothetical protein IPM24_24865 [Bryobacterales bacterium]|nr:hypothetical protein [Bryobacterales bacterium]
MTPPPAPPPPFDQLAHRPFSFYPPIVNIEHNSWVFGRATWSETMVINTKTNEEVWIPRRFLGKVSQVDEPVVIVGLTRELESRSGAVVPHHRRVIEMPVAVNAPRGVAPVVEQAAPVVNIRLEPGESRIGRLILGALLVGVLATVAVVVVTSHSTLRPRIVFTAKDQAFLELRYSDGYYSVVEKLGPPAETRSRQAGGDIFYQILAYPDRAYSVVLMGSDEKVLHYIGAVDQNWRPVHHVRIPGGGGDSAALLRNLKRF